MRKLIINESQIDMFRGIISEGSVLNDISKTLRKHLTMNKTSLGKHPSFPPDGIIPFSEQVIGVAYTDSLTKLKHVFGENIDIEPTYLRSELTRLYGECKLLEAPIKESLEKVCFNTVVELFNIPDNVVDFSCVLVDKVTTDIVNNRLHPESIDELEFNDINDLHLVGEEIYKRRLINSLICGAADSLSNKTNLYISDIFDLNTKLPELYQKIFALNTYLLFVDDVIISDSDDNTRGGSCKVVVKLNEDKSKVLSEGLIFPILLYETIKGFMELFSIHGLPKDRKRAQYIIKKADFLLSEPWDMRFGTQLWNKLNINNTSSIAGVFVKLVENEPSVFHDIMREIFGNTKKGKMLINLIEKECKDEEEQHGLMDRIEQRQIDTILLNDGYVTEDEL